MTEDPLVIAEIHNNDITTFDVIGPNHDAVMLAADFLSKQGAESMAHHVRAMARKGLLRLGPVHGFLAAAINLKDSEYIVLSNQYPQHLSTIELAISIIHEIGAISTFNETQINNEHRAARAIDMFKHRRESNSSMHLINEAFRKLTQQTKA